MVSIVKVDQIQNADGTVEYLNTGTIKNATLDSTVTGGSGITAHGTVASGTLDSSVNINSALSSATFPAGHVRQVFSGDLGVIASGDTDVYFPNSLQFANPILTSSDVLLIATGTAVTRTAHNDVNVSLYFSSADGGSLGAGASGYKFNNALMSYINTIHVRIAWAGNYLVTNPNSTTPTYRVFANRVTNYNAELEGAAPMTMMEITR